MRIKRMVIKNFKGLRELVIPADSRDVAIYGDNGVGKTTTIDAWLWLITGKDSLGQADFEIKPHDALPQSGMSPEVEVELTDPDGKNVIISKIYEEVWTKKRGSAQKEFSGHEVKYFFDAIPVKKKEFDRRMSELAPEETFRLLTNPRYFSEQLHWQKRRELLLSVCGDVSDADVIAATPKLSTLPTILNGKAIDDHRAIILSRRAKINQELDDNRVRMGETQGQKPDISGLNRISLHSELDGINAKTAALKSKMEVKPDDRIAGLQSRAVQVKAEIAIADRDYQSRRNMITDEINGIQGQIDDRKRSVATDQANANRDYESRKQTVSSEIDAITRRLETLQYDRLQVETEQRDVVAYIATATAEIERLRNEWTAEKSRVLVVPEAEKTCPTCHQDMPEAMRNAWAENFRATEEKRRTEKLNQISSYGSQHKESLVKAKVHYAELEKRFHLKNTAIATDSSLLADKQAELSQIQPPHAIVVDVTELVNRLNEKQAELSALSFSHNGGELTVKLSEIESQIKEIESASKPDFSLEREELKVLGDRHALVLDGLSRLDQFDRHNARIEELKTSTRTLAAEFERLEEELRLCELFITSKSEMLDSKINSAFMVARFRLFNRLINGGIEPCCELVKDGVGYGSMNDAHRINAGIDIINTFSRFYDVEFPIFIDNAITVNEILPSPAQQIKLIVSRDAKLRIEVAP